MTAAYYLDRAGYDVEVFEKNSRPGGLINTVETKWGPCETAANGTLNSKAFEDLAAQVGLELLPSQKISRRRYIFRDRLRRWPLNFFETLILFFHFIFSRKRPYKEETIKNWGERVLGVAGTKYALAILQGIYAGDPSRMSASLILKRLFDRKKKIKSLQGHDGGRSGGDRSQIRGLVSPKGGMLEFFVKTERTHYE